MKKNNRDVLDVKFSFGWMPDIWFDNRLNNEYNAVYPIGYQIYGLIYPVCLILNLVSGRISDIKVQISGTSCYLCFDSKAFDFFFNVGSASCLKLPDPDHT